MRVLLVDHDAAALNKVTSALRGVVELDCVSTKADALMLLKQKSFDVLIACERVADGSGLDLLGRVGKSGGDLQRIFAAAPERLQLLGTRLQPFNVTRTIGYPIDLEELWLALAAVTSGEDPSIEGTVEHVVMEDIGEATARAASGSNAPAAPAGAAAAAKSANTQPALAISHGATARKVAVEFEPEPVRRPAAVPQTAAARAPAAPAPTPQAAPASATRVARPVPPPTRQPELEEIATIAAAAVRSPAATGRKRKPPTAVMVGIAALVALGAIAAVLVLREPAQPVASNESDADLNASAGPLAKQNAAAFAAQIAALESRIEDALMRDDLNLASAAQAELAAIAPTHPRLAFFAAALQRASDMNSLGKGTKTPPPARASAPTAPAPEPSSAAPLPTPVVTDPATLAAPTPAASVDTSTLAAPNQARSINKSSRSENTKFQGRTLEESANIRKQSGATAAVALAQGEPASDVATESTQTAETALVPAKLVKRVSPAYPTDAAARGIEGFAEVEFTVTAEGRVTDVKVVDSAPRRAFDSAAREAVRKWQFEPAQRDAQAYATTARARLEFKLED